MADERGVGTVTVPREEWLALKRTARAALVAARLVDRIRRNDFDAAWRALDDALHALDALAVADAGRGAGESAAGVSSADE